MQPNINQAAEALPRHHLTPVAGGKQDETIASLTGLRIYAALAVFFSHMYHFQYFGLPPVLVLLVSSLGQLGVSLFYVLSGFVLYLRYHQGFQQKADIRAFYIARFARIYPVFLLTALLALPIEWFSAFRSQLPLTLGTQATLTHCLLPQTCGRLNDLGWSVGIEASFYVLFPALLLLVSNSKRLIAGLLLLSLSLWGFQFITGESFYGSARFFLNRVPEFLLGILAGWLYVRQVQLPLLKKVTGKRCP